VTRKYDTSVGKYDDVWAAPADPDAWTPASTVASTPENRKSFDDFLFTSSLSDAMIGLDYEAQSVDIKMDFYDKNRVYNASGIVGIRNSYVTNSMRNRTAIDVTVTTTTTGGGSSGSGSGTEGGTGTGN
jgi:hypothetical protein